VLCTAYQPIETPLKKSDFHFELPTELIAQAPLAERTASRMLLLDAAADRLEDRQFKDLPQWLNAGDLLIFNDTRVLPARVFGRKASGGEVEVLVERLFGGHEIKAQVRASKSPRVGTWLILGEDVRVEVLGRDEEFYRLRFASNEPVERILMRIGHMPLPPYVRRAADASDLNRYQTVFAREPGAVAAPTAGLHFDDAMLQLLTDKGVQFGHITLHVGAGTFQPMRVDSLHDHRMHSEWLNVGAELCDKIRRTHAAGGRVIAVGTTVVRALESAIRDGEVLPFAGETRIFIFPGYVIRSVDALLTNFHLPESTLLMLVSAFAGRERVLAAYKHAVAARYRFFSYGDAMLIFPPKSNAQPSVQPGTPHAL
jgi:S-adenosylmethionine:tRNA ribosyltransferase-isomerase